MDPVPDKPGPAPWVTRADAVAALALGTVLTVAVGVIVYRNHHAGDNVKVVVGTDTGYRIDLNSAGVSEMQLLPGVGPTRAARLAAWRTAHGPFVSFDELRKAGGLSVKDIERIKPLATLGATAPAADAAPAETQ